MTINFEEIAQRALEQGEVDEPNEDDAQDALDLEACKKMDDLRTVINDLCVFAGQQGMDSDDIFTVLATFLGESMVRQSGGGVEETKELYRQITSIMAAVVTDAIIWNKLNRLLK